MTSLPPFKNPFRPGAGHAPPYLAGREEETQEFAALLQQDPILENLVLTGLRGVGKTVLLDTFKPLAQKFGWLWVGTDLSESTSLTEENVAIRLLTDLATVTSVLVVEETERAGIGFGAKPVPISRSTLDYDALTDLFNKTPGLVSDKLKAVLETAWAALSKSKQQPRGIVFAYDEAQNLADHAPKGQFPLSLLLDVFQSMQKKGLPLLLALTGLPTLFPKLVDARTFSERMFRTMFLRKLSKKDSREAIVKPMNDTNCPLKFDETSVGVIVDTSGGYPYFIQFICREVFDAYLANSRLTAADRFSVPIIAITRKLDANFFSGRWQRVTDRQRQLMYAISALENCDEEFTVQEVVESSKNCLDKAFSSSHVSQILTALANAGLVYKNRHGKYSFAVPLFHEFVMRQVNTTR